MKWRIECQTCQRAKCYGYGVCFACDDYDECKYEPFVNSASSSITIQYNYKSNKTMSKMQEYFQGLVQAGIIPQEPMNYDAASMKIYIAHLEEENEKLKERLKELQEGKK